MSVGNGLADSFIKGYGQFDIRVKGISTHRLCL